MNIEEYFQIAFDFLILGNTELRICGDELRCVYTDEHGDTQEMALASLPR